MFFCLYRRGYAESIWIVIKVVCGNRFVFNFLLEIFVSIFRFCVDQLTPNMQPGQLFTSIGYFCYKGSRTDWGPGWGIRKLLGTLESRRDSPLSGSYTNRLLDDPLLLRLATPSTCPSTLSERMLNADPNC